MIINDPVVSASEIEQVAKIAEQRKSLPGALLPILHQVQATLGFVPKAAVPIIAQELNLSRAEVHGVLSFYHHFRTERPAKYCISLCRAEACQALHARELEQHVKQHLNIDFHRITEDHRFSLEPVYCLGNCACGPSLMINGQVHGRVTPQSFDNLLKSLAGE